MQISKHGDFQNPVKSPYNFERHQSDLERLKPSEAEMERAVEWCLTQKRTAEFVQDLKRVLSDLGREDLAYYLE